MSTDFSIRPVGTPAAPTIVQPSNQAVSNAVQTDLPPSQSVTAADSSVLVRNEAQEKAQSQFFLSHEAYYDRTAASMVYQVVDRKTSEVVEQYPDEAVLRRRAYFNSLEKDVQREETPPAHPTDRTA